MRQLLTDLRGNPISFAARRRQRRVRHPHLPTLFYLVQNQSWNEVLRRARTHPQEVQVQEDVSGNSPLHIACRLNPPQEVVRALLEASRLTNAEGSTPLHLASTHRCSVEVIRVLLEEATVSSNTTSPTACLTQMGRAPIHYACMSFRGLSVEAFRTLLEFTIRYGNIETEEEEDDDFDLIDEDDSSSDKVSSDVTKDSDGIKKKVVNVMTMRDCTGQTPLGLLFRRYRERVRCVIQTIERLRTDHPGNQMASIAAAMTVQSDLGELWEKARIIVGRLTEERLQREEAGSATEPLVNSPGEEAVAQEAAAWAAEQYRWSLSRQGSRSDMNEGREEPEEVATVGSRTFRIVHASVGLTGYGCPPEMIRLAISIHPNQTKEMDEDGNLPLHIAAVASSYMTCSSTTTGSSTYDRQQQQPSTDEDSLVSDFSFLSHGTSNSSNHRAFDKVIQILLHAFPAAARIPHGRSGRLPLMLAIEAKRRTWDDGIRTLLEAYPPSLSSRRNATPLTLYPYVLSKVGNREDTERVVLVEGSLALPSPGRLPLARRTATLPLAGSTSATRRRRHRKRQGLTTLFELVKANPELLMHAAGQRTVEIPDNQQE